MLKMAESIFAVLTLTGFKTLSGLRLQNAQIKAF